MNVCFISSGGCNVRQLQSERLKVGFAGETTFHTAVFKKKKYCPSPWVLNICPLLNDVTIVFTLFI